MQIQDLRICLLNEMVVTVCAFVRISTIHTNSFRGSNNKITRRAECFFFFNLGEAEEIYELRDCFASTTFIVSSHRFVRLSCLSHFGIGFALASSS